MTKASRLRRRAVGDATTGWDPAHWPAPVVRKWGPVTFTRSRAGFGWHVRVKRVQWNSTAAVTAGWPRVVRGADEHCNRSVTLCLWPLGALDVWWDPRWRTGPGYCESCTAEHVAEWGWVSACCSRHYPPMTVDQAAARLGMPADAVRLLVEAGRLDLEDVDPPVRPDVLCGTSVEDYDRASRAREARRRERADETTDESQADGTHLP